MNEQEIIRDVTAIIADVSGFEEDEITIDSNLAQDLEIDSIKAIEITVAIEKKYNLKVQDEDIPKITTVRHAVDLVSQKLGIVSSNAQTNQQPV